MNSALYIGCGLAQAFVLLVRIVLWLVLCAFAIPGCLLDIAATLCGFAADAIAERIEALNSDLESLDRRMR